jgi:hypothetical protein
MGHSQIQKGPLMSKGASTYGGVLAGFAGSGRFLSQG